MPRLPKPTEEFTRIYGQVSSLVQPETPEQKVSVASVALRLVEVETQFTLFKLQNGIPDNDIIEATAVPSPVRIRP